MKHKKLLFSKNEKVDKSTSMGLENEKAGDKLGVPKSNEKESNQEKEKMTKKNESKQNQNKDNEKKKEKPSNIKADNVGSNISLKDLENKTKNLIKDLEEKKKKLKVQEEEYFNNVNLLNEQLKEKNAQIKKLSNDFNKMIERLKDHEKKLVIKDKIKKEKGKTDEEIEKEKKLIIEQIKIYKNRATESKKKYDLYLKTFAKKENKENDMQTTLTSLNDEISSLNENIHELKLIEREHQHCEMNNKKLMEQFILYQSKIKKAEKSSKSNIPDLIDERNNKDDDDGNGNDNIEKAIEEEKNFLPKIKNLQLSVDTGSSLEAKIIKRNKIGKTKSGSNAINAINLYNKIDKECKDNERYKKEKEKENKKKKPIIKNKSNIQFKSYLFTDYDNEVLQRILPKEMLNSYKDKFNNILKKKQEIKKIIATESSEIKNENFSLINKKDFNELKLKELKIKYLTLNNTFFKLKEKINNTKKSIKDIENEIQREDKKLKMKENEAKRILIYFKGRQKMSENKNGNGHDGGNGRGDGNVSNA